MSVSTIISRYPDQEACIERLERVRWGDHPTCPKCESQRVTPKADSGRVGRWNCHACHTSFNVLSGTIFQKTKIPLPKWFLAIGLMTNGGASLSSRQLSRDLDVTQPTALFMQRRIREQLATEQGEAMLRDIVKGHQPQASGISRECVE